MWAHGEGNSENHKKGYCSDGVKQKMVTIDGIPEELLPWLQPNNIFMRGMYFWLKHFCRMAHELYNTIIDSNTTGGMRVMEFKAFMDMLCKRLVIIPATATEASCIRFKLYCGLELGEQPGSPSDIVDVDGVKYLHIMYLLEDAFQEVAAHV